MAYNCLQANKKSLQVNELLLQLLAECEGDTVVRTEAEGAAD